MTSQLLADQVTRHSGQIGGHAGRGGMGAVRGAEGVVDIHIRHIRQRLGEGGIVRFLLLMEAHVLDQGDLAILQRGGGLWAAIADNVAATGNGLPSNSARRAAAALTNTSY